MARLFVAINFCDSTVQKLFEGVSVMKGCAQRINPSRKENLHLTLAFIGETTKIRSATAALDEVSAPTFKLEISGYGEFSSRSGSIGFIKASSPDNALSDLAAKVRAELTKQGFHIDTKPFRPHITLCREFIPDNSFTPTEVTSAVGTICEQVHSISLMKSERINGRLTYTEIFRKKLNA